MKRIVLIGLLSAFTPLVLYLFCLSPGISWEDSGEFITTAATLGIAHPPGHPLYVLCAHLFTIGNSALSVAHSVNLFSAFAAFLALLVFAILIQLHAPPYIPYNTPVIVFVSVFSITLLFAFSKTFWAVAGIAEVYTLHALLALCLIASLLLLSRRGGTALFLFAYVLGLSLTNNITIGYLIPAFACFLILERSRFSRKQLLLSLLFFLLGISLYMYIPIRARFHPVFNWGDARTLKNLIHLLTAREFSKDFLSFTYAEKTLFPTLFQLLREISFWGIVPFGFGIFLLWQRARNFAILFIVAMGCNLIFSFLTGRGPDLHAYFLPSIIISFLVIGYGIMGFLPLLRDKAWVALPLLFLLSLLPLGLNFSGNCLRGDADARNYGSALLRWLPEKSVLLTENTNDYFILTYLKEIEVSKDLEILYAPLFKESWYLERLSSLGYRWKGPLTPISFAKGYPGKVFYTPGAGISLPAANLTPQGPLFRIVMGKEMLDKNVFILPQPVHEKGKKRYAFLFSRFGEYYYKREHYPFAIAAFEQALKFDPNNPALYHNLALLYRETGNLEKSREYEETAEKLGFEK